MVDEPQDLPRDPGNLNRTQAWQLELIKLGCPSALAAKAALILNYQAGPLTGEEEAVIADAWACCDLSRLPKHH